MLRDPRTILTALKGLIEAIKLPVEFGDPLLPAFQAVKIYDLEDLGKALEELLVFTNRCAFVILENADHETEIQGSVLTSRRTITVTVLLADRNWSNRQKALVGDETTPGAVYLGHLLVDGLAGEQAGFIIEPGFGEIFALQGKARDNATGRIAWRQELKIPAGSLSRSLSRIAVR